MILSVHQPQYLAWLGFFDKIDKSDAFVFLDNVQYKPREFQNRNKIRTPEGYKWLSVPVLIKGSSRQMISQAKIDNGHDWQREHWNSLKICYNKANSFKGYAGFFEEVYSRPWEKLADLNIYLVNYILGEFRLDKPVYIESELEINAQGTDRIIEICRKLKSDTYLSGAGGKGYLEENKFIDAGIKLKYQEFTHPVYDQLYRQSCGFLPNMSAVDLLFNQGKESIEILRKVNRRN